MKKFKLISMCIIVMIVLTTMFTFNKVNAATTQAQVTYGEITDNGVEVTIKFTKDISSNSFSKEWEKVDKNTIKRTFKEGGYAYVKVEDSNGDKEEGIVAVPIKLEINENLNMTPSDSNLSITNLKSEDTSIATVDKLNIKAIKEGTTQITGDVKFSNDDEIKKCTWNLTVTKKEETKPDEDKPAEDKPAEDKSSDEKPADSSKDNTKVELTKDEIKEIEDFISISNRDKNDMAFLFVNYTSPEDLIKKIADESIEQYLGVYVTTLRYAFGTEAYGRNATNEEMKMMNMEDMPAPFLIKEEGLIKFFKEKINYKYTETKLRNDFKKYYNEKVDAYVFIISDTLSEEIKIKSGYKINNKYYLNIEFTDIDEKVKSIELVVEKNDEKYTFYSCNNSAINGTNSKNDVKDQTTADRKIPQTGINNTILFVIATGTIIGTVSIIRYRKYKNIK